MDVGLNRCWRFWIAAIAVCTLLVISTLALAPSHGHSQTDNACAICQAGQLPYVASVVPGLTPPAFTRTHVLEAEVQHGLEQFYSTGHSRAPPIA